MPLEGVPVAETGDNPEATAIGRELEERLRRAVDRLPQRESAVFCLRYFEELSYQQIAETLEMSDSAVGTALNKARGKLQAMLCETAEGET